jgi:hypothetical protein
MPASRRSRIAPWPAGSVSPAPPLPTAPEPQPRPDLRLSLRMLTQPGRAPVGTLHEADEGRGGREPSLHCPCSPLRDRLSWIHTSGRGRSGAVARATPAHPSAPLGGVSSRGGPREPRRRRRVGGSTDAGEGESTGREEAATNREGTEVRV